MRPIMFKHTHFLKDTFGHPEAIVRILSAYDLPCPRPDTAAKWFQRGSIPSDWLPLILCAVELDRGAPVRLANYVEIGGNTQ